MIACRTAVYQIDHRIQASEIKSPNTKDDSEWQIYLCSNTCVQAEEQAACVDVVGQLGQTIGEAFRVRLHVPWYNEKFSIVPIVITKRAGLKHPQAKDIKERSKKHTC